MTTDELKAHRRAICEALIEGKQCQALFPNGWFDCQPETAAAWAFRSEKHAGDVRIKPEPRKVWIGWHEDQMPYSKFAILAQNDDHKKWLTECYPNVHWQLVEEPQ